MPFSTAGVLLSIHCADGLGIPADLMESATHAELDERLGSLRERRPDLDAAAALQGVLLGRMIAIVARVAAQSGPVLASGTVAARLKQGVPALRDEAVVLPTGLLAPELIPLCDALGAGGAGEAAEHIADALRSGRIDKASLVAASFRRDQASVRTFANHAALAPDLLWLVAELAAGPFAFVMQSNAFADAVARAALDAWTKGYCPGCASWPAFAEITGGARRLRCSFCAAIWAPSVCRCVYCGEDGPAFTLAAPDAERLSWRLELCAACGGYLKSFEAERPSRYPLLAVDDMETMPLDMAAIQRGYGRPPLPELGRPLLPGCGVMNAAADESR
jgi:FdhE protein